MDLALLLTFLVLFSGLWLSVFGYVLVLSLLSRRGARRRDPGQDGLWPEIAIVIPTLNEEQHIGDKLNEIRNLDYPKDRMRVVVVDKGSSDRTVQRVREEMERGSDLELICLPDARRKSDQVNFALGALSQEFLVFTDADSRLDRSCVKELIQALRQDQEAAIVGANVTPTSPLLVEHLHWCCLNTLWWLEGEVLGAAGLSGVCYAVRRALIQSMPDDTTTEDIRQAMTARANGYAVRLCRTAIAHELRTPRSAREVLSFRRRRGAAYLVELRRLAGLTHASLRWRLARRLKIWYFTSAPVAAVGLAALGLWLSATPHWPYVAAATATFLVSLFTSLILCGRRELRRASWPRAAFALVRYPVLLFLSLLSLRTDSMTQSPLGGSAPSRLEPVPPKPRRTVVSSSSGS